MSTFDDFMIDEATRKDRRIRELTEELQHANGCWKNQCDAENKHLSRIKELEAALNLWCPQCDMKLLERTALDCGHGQIVQTGCTHCERKLGRTDVELQPISDHCEHEWSAVRRGFHQCLKNCGAYMDALNGRVLTASALLAADRCKNMTHKRYGLKECIECVPPLGLCSDCPPAGYPTNKTRCDTCPRLDPYPELP